MKRSVVLASLILAALLSPAYSANVTVIAEGVFSEYTDPDGLLPFSEPAPGTIFKMVFTYDSDTSKFGPAPDLGIFFNSISKMSLMIGGDTFGRGTHANDITILNDAPATEGGFLDAWLASTITRTPTGTPNEELSEGFSLVLLNVTPSTPVSPLTSTDLVPPTWPSAWETAFISYDISRLTTGGATSPESLASAEAIITSISVVPVPAAIWLFGSALGLLGWRARRVA